ncbi:hypothetical protein [Caballeronia sp. LZ035]|uniref:glucosamine inositolphosphorylceramide transferase family protein n=1 Tax=Caballeronia sp. LZ035 TaxID=3038568 RepID=UPI00285A0896|nr:hypothetical protein [Caballeronia sp. LZ035]MDR5759814.1 hypothetical protein [Caballeronia sp. LZ035]
MPPFSWHAATSLSNESGDPHGGECHPDNRAYSTMNMNQRFPLMLDMWVRFERMLYKTSPGDMLPGAGRSAHPQCEVLYNGSVSITNLWKTLLMRETPHLQIVWRAPGEPARLIAESHVAIPNRLFFCNSLSLALERQRLLCERARQRLETAASPRDFPVIDLTGETTRMSNADVMRFAFRHLREKVVNQLRKRFSRRGHWGIAIQRADPGVSAEGAQWWLQIPSPSDRFFADPFPWRDAAGQYHLFFEDLPYATGKGVISHVVLDPATNTWDAPPRIVLERPYHLSYPFIFDYEGEVFMIPETSGNRTIEVYRAAPFPDTWVHHATLMQDILAADTTLLHEANTWWLFTTIEQGEGPNWDELHLYNAPTPFGPWHPHPGNPIVSDCRRARMAGNIFRDDEGRLVRPAQDCEREYGAAVWFCEITKLDMREYAESPIRVKHAAPGQSGLHTWNQAGDITVVDIKMNLSRRASARMEYSRL